MASCGAVWCACRMLFKAEGRAFSALRLTFCQQTMNNTCTAGLFSKSYRPGSLSKVILISLANIYGKSASLGSMDATAPDEALRAYLAEEIAIYEGYGDPSKLPSIFLDLFTTYRDEDCQTATHNVTRRINAEYWDVYLPSDSLIKSQEDKGMAEFLSRLNNLVFGLALLIGYDDPRQDALLQVLVELRKLPPKPFKVWRVSLSANRQGPTADLMIGRLPCLRSRTNVCCHGRGRMA